MVINQSFLFVLVFLALFTGLIVYKLLSGLSLLTKKKFIKVKL